MRHTGTTERRAPMPMAAVIRENRGKRELTVLDYNTKHIVIAN